MMPIGRVYLRFERSVPPQVHRFISRNQANAELAHQARAALIDAGLTLPPTNTPPPGKLTAEQRAALARRLSGDRPMSDLISEDREGR